MKRTCAARMCSRATPRLLPHTVLCLLWRLFGVAQGACLPNALPEANRTYLQGADGSDLPVGFLVLDWQTAHLATEIAKILVEEVLGYHTQKQPEIALSTTNALYAMVGCTRFNEATNRGCPDLQADSRIHVALDTWVGTNGASWAEVQAMSRAPEDLGTIGYSGHEQMFIKKSAMDWAYQDAGLMLDFHKGYNASFHKAHIYFDTIFDLDWTRLKPCHFPGSQFQDTATMSNYLRWTGDVHGVAEVSEGTVVAKCHQTHWWVAPTCRHNISECIPALTYGTGFHAYAFMQWSAIHGIPIAMAVAKDWSAYTAFVREHQIAFYWWIPDVTFIELAPQSVIMPRHSAQEWSQGFFRTAAMGSYVNKVASYDLRVKSELLFKFMENLAFDIQEMEQLLLDMLQSNSQTPLEHAACNWIRSETNRARWSSWIPVSTNCGAGLGLWNTHEGRHVQNRSEAQGCHICQEGEQSQFFSDDDGASHRCVRCQPGYFQGEAGQMTCTRCVPGSVSRTTGAVECELCPLGRYANSSGLTTCHACDDGNPKVTTSFSLERDGQTLWLQFEGANSMQYCTCIPGTFLHEGRCEECLRGSSCPGSGKIELLPGFFSPVQDPGSVFECLDPPERCPGGAPGRCAEGRDLHSLACSLCLPGWYERMGSCTPCRSSDYVFIGFFLLISTVGVGTVHFCVMRTGQQQLQSRGLVITVLIMSQFIFVIQVFSVIQSFNIVWGEPFISLLRLLEEISLERLLRSLNVFSCISRVDPITAYVTSTLVLPIFLLAVPALTHVLVLACMRSRTPKLTFLGKTCGSLYVLFYIALCSNLLVPFRCFVHPNGQATLKSFDGVLCNLQGEHLHMSLVGGFGFLFPIGFLAVIAWVVWFELPKRLASLDVKFMRATSFLSFRFRPGQERSAFVFIVRDTLLVLSPLMHSATLSVICMNIVLYVNMVWVAHVKPWRKPEANAMNLILICGLISILDLGSFFVEEEERTYVMLASTLVAISLFIGMTALAAYGVVQHLAARYRKPYRFFLCHHKMAAGSLARLLKTQFQNRGPNFTTFVDTDDLTDLADLFGLVSNQVKTLIVLASSEILRRKWCIGEMVTAHVQKVETVLVVLPGFGKPADSFIHNYMFIVPDIKDLASYSISIADVQSTLRWLKTLEVLELQTLAHPEVLDDVVTRLTSTPGARIRAAATERTQCVILADPDNMEAMATAYVLFALLSPRMIKEAEVAPPGVLVEGHDVPVGVTSVLLICSYECLACPDIAKWILQTSMVEACAVLPIIAEDSFQFPSNTSVSRLLVEDALQHLDVKTYASLVRLIFEEVAIYFSARASSSLELELRLNQLAFRLRTSRPKPLSVRYSSAGSSIAGSASASDDLDPRPHALRLSSLIDSLPPLPQHCLEDGQVLQGLVEDTDGTSASIKDWESLGAESLAVQALGAGPMIEERF